MHRVGRIFTRVTILDNGAKKMGTASARTGASRTFKK